MTQVIGTTNEPECRPSDSNHGRRELTIHRDQRHAGCRPWGPDLACRSVWTFTDYFGKAKLAVMSGVGNFYTTEQAARRLGVTVRRVQQMLDDGDLTRLARGLVDAASLDRYAATGASGRTRVWAEHTAWGAIALLSGVQPNWLGSAQASRLRTALRATTDTADLVARVHDRAVVRSYAGHPVARKRLQTGIVSTEVAGLGLVDANRAGANFSGTGTLDAGAPPNSVDGYLAAETLDSTVLFLGLIEDPSGPITLRVTGFDISIVRELAESKTAILAALDAATSLDPRERGVGRQVLAATLAEYRR